MIGTSLAPVAVIHGYDLAAQIAKEASRIIKVTAPSVEVARHRYLTNLSEEDLSRILRS